MGDEPRFPPPHGEEPIGYRDAVAPISEKPEPPVPSHPLAPRGKRVVASRPDDFDVALAKAFTPPRTKPRPSSWVATAILVIVVIVYIGFELASQTRRPSRRVPTVSAAQ